MAVILFGPARSSLSRPALSLSGLRRALLEVSQCCSRRATRAMPKPFSYADLAGKVRDVLDGA